MKIHLISIGGAVMHNLALELQRQGHDITGSDDEVFEPSNTRLLNAGLLPKKMGWHAESITNDIDIVILGMHAKSDNPELIEAQKLGLNIQSFPEFVYNQSKNKTRIVVAGSHGKTSTTAMIMHILKNQNIDFDYLVGSKLEGFELMVKLSDAPYIILEGDEYLSSAIDLRPKFLWYKPHIAIITGVAWDHINVFPTFENYVEQFKLFSETILQNGSLIYYKNDEPLAHIAQDITHAKTIAYQGLNTIIGKDSVSVDFNQKLFVMKVFGEHNFQNMEAAVLACKQMGISEEESLKAMQSFVGTARRLEEVYNKNNIIIYRDFAHSPSKVKATVDAVKNRFRTQKVIAVLELHTYSSLNKDFMPLYKNTMKMADVAFVHYNEHVFEMKRMEVLDEMYVKSQFGNVEVETNIDQLWQKLHNLVDENTIFLMMSSGNFGGKDVLELVH
ncbi:MAG: peptidoglycan synthetase [Flavobacteriales bacterium]|nr:peptidoglycan synthetase [Flavobacteriales bacterium]